MMENILQISNELPSGGITLLWEFRIIKNAGMRPELRIHSIPENGCPDISKILSEICPETFPPIECLWHICIWQDDGNEAVNLFFIFLAYSGILLNTPWSWNSILILWRRKKGILLELISEHADCRVHQSGCGTRQWRNFRNKNHPFSQVNTHTPTPPINWIEFKSITG